MKYCWLQLDEFAHIVKRLCPCLWLGAHIQDAVHDILVSCKGETRDRTLLHGHLVATTKVELKAKTSSMCIHGDVVTALQLLWDHVCGLSCFSFSLLGFSFSLSIWLRPVAQP